MNIDIIQNFSETKLYIPSKPVTISPTSENDEITTQQQKKPAKTTELEYLEVNINELMNQIIDALKENSSDWFHESSPLRQLIPQALNYVDYNIKRNNNYIFEFETLLRSAQQTQENEFLKKNQEEQHQAQSPSPIPSPVPVTNEKEHKKRSKSLKVLNRSAEKTPVLGTKNDHLNIQSETNLNGSMSTSAQSVNIDQSKMHASINISSYLTDLRQQEAVQLSYRYVEQNIMQIGYCLNIFNRFWSKVSSNKGSFDDHLNLFYLNNFDNLTVFSQLDQFLYKIHWQIANKNENDAGNDLDAHAFSQELHAILLTPTTNKNLLNINFLLNYYRLISYDFISFKLFIRQLQLTQIAAILCQIIYKILNLYHKKNKSADESSQQLNFSKEFLVFPKNQYRPISWSNNHVTLHHNSFKTSTQFSNSQASMNNHNVPREETDFDNLFISDLKDFLNLSINRLNCQASLINSTGYFYIVNKSTGLVLEAMEPSILNEKSNTIQKSKAARFYLTKKEKSRGEQLWYYYAYNGCIVNKLVRSGYCMAVSSLNPKSPVCLFPNVRTTNCKWFFNHVDNTITSGLSENLALDYTNDEDQKVVTINADDSTQKKRFAVIINKKDVTKPSQKWSIEFQ